MFYVIRLRILAVVLCLLPMASMAADVAANNHHATLADSPVTFSYILQILASFVAVILFILLLAWLMRKTGKYGSANSKSFKIISSMSLGMREKILLVDVEGVSILLGVAPGQIRTLHVLGRTQARGEAEMQMDGGGFERIISKFLK